MDGLTLLTEARSAGLTVTAEGERLVVRGPRLAGELAQRLLSHKADVLDALARDPAAEQPPDPTAEQTPDLTALAHAIAELVRRRRERGAPIREVILVVPATEPAPAKPDTSTDARPAPKLSDVLPPVSWLIPAQRRLWRQRTAAYVVAGWPRPAAEQEAMAELICTGKLYNLNDTFPRPK